MKYSAALKSFKHAGFTLIELMIAVGIFSLLTTLSYSLISSVLQTKERTDLRAKKLIERDFSQVIARPVRDEYGDSEPAMSAKNNQGIAFSRIGWTVSPLIESVNTRSELQRIRYFFEKGELIRSFWRYPDRAPQVLPESTTLLTDVEDLQLRFLTKKPASTSWSWVTDWPSVSSAATAQVGVIDESIRMLPKVVEMTINVKPFGEIKRQFLLVDNLAATPLKYFPGAQSPTQNTSQDNSIEYESSSLDSVSEDSSLTGKEPLNDQGTSPTDDESEDIKNATIR